ncbi:uncharacterized protein LOC108666195 [Hyalella azteca]|uniref:Uncharacterized protein LOC108666195 n=1 Tax=Hyalella azteca TaxID=294128 RepID=A0A8B7N3U9_HYAAZ|nr:uncharacterized protein LOC108666195 [Hyalella azteca]
MTRNIVFVLSLLVAVIPANQAETRYPRGLRSRLEADDFFREEAAYYDDVGLTFPDEEHVAYPQRLRVRRQLAASSLGGNHEDRNGAPRPVGKLHGFLNADGGGNSRNNHHVNVGAGLGSVVWRSPNQRHSVGVGATVDHSRGRVDGFNFHTKPNVGVGVGYKWKF